MADKFLYFTFDGISSEKYNCFYINEGEDLIFPVFPTFSDQKSSPLFQQHTYYLGTSIQDKTFSLNFACHDLSLKKFRELQRWLAIDKISDLYLDWIPNYHYNVKISAFSNATILPLYETAASSVDSLYHFLFSISFTTIEDYAAISNETYKCSIKYDSEDPSTINGEELTDPTYLLPLVDYDPLSLLNLNLPSDVYKIRLFNPEPYPYYLNINTESVDSFWMKLMSVNNNRNNGSIQWYTYPLGTSYPLTIESRLGYVLTDNELIERKFLNDQERQQSFVNKGKFEVSPGNIYQATMELIHVQNSNITGLPGEFVYLTFNIDRDDVPLFDYNSISNNTITEGSDCKVVAVQPPNITDYILYNREHYSDGKYYVNDLSTYVSYFFAIDDNKRLVIAIKDDDAHETFSRFYYKLNGTLPSGAVFDTTGWDNKKESIISIYDYTEIDLYLGEGANQPKNGTLAFNLRTVF